MYAWPIAAALLAGFFGGAIAAGAIVDNHHDRVMCPAGMQGSMHHEGMMRGDSDGFQFDSGIQPTPMPRNEGYGQGMGPTYGSGSMDYPSDSGEGSYGVTITP